MQRRGDEEAGGHASSLAMASPGPAERAAAAAPPPPVTFQSGAAGSFSQRHLLNPPPAGSVPEHLAPRPSYRSQGSFATQFTTGAQTVRSIDTRMLPQLPVFAINPTGAGELIIVSTREARKRTTAYVHSTWRKLCDSSLLWRVRLSCLKQLLFCTLEFPHTSLYATWLSYVLIGAILVNAINVIAGSFAANQTRPTTCAAPVCMPGDPGALCSTVVCHPHENDSVWLVNAITVCIFTLDYLVRLFTVHAVPASVLYSGRLAINLNGDLIDVKKEQLIQSRGGWRKTWGFVTSFFGVVDLLSILPFFSNVFLRPYGTFKSSEPEKADFLVALRMLRTLKLFRYSRQYILFERTMQASGPALRFFVFMSTIVLTCFAALTYYFEKGEFMVTPQHPEGAYYRIKPWSNNEREISPFDNLATTLYWTVVTTTSLKASLAVSSTGGKFLSCILAYAGIVMLSLPLSIIGRHFQRQYDMLNVRDEVMASDWSNVPEGPKELQQQQPRPPPITRIATRFGGSYLVQHDEGTEEDDEPF